MNSPKENQHEFYMKKALDLAFKGFGKTLNNPMVGCLVVHNGVIIGQGYHEKYGGPHAEPNAINSVKDKSLISESDIYVTLEPCAHHGKTPPCSDLIASYGPKNLYICNADPNPLVSGKGIPRIEAKGTKVYWGILEKEGRKLNKRFFTYHEKKRPFIILKWAETKDGFIARKNYDSKWISSIESRTLVHQWRTEESAIMVGTNTALHDNPQLNARLYEGKDPVRVVLDKQLRLPQNLHLFDQTIPTICYNQIRNDEIENLNYVKLDTDKSLLTSIFDDLYQKQIQSIIIEGGSYLLQGLIQKELWDEARIFVGNQEFGGGIDAPNINGNLVEKKSIAEDILRVLTND